MWKNWTNNRIDWNDTSTAFGSNWTDGWFPLQTQEPVYRNGQRLKNGEQRPKPFYLGSRAKVACQSHKLEVVGSSPTSPIKHTMKLCGAYSRKYDKPRKFRRRRLF